MTVIEIQSAKFWKTVMLLFLVSLLTLGVYTFLTFDVSNIGTVEFLYTEKVSETANEIIEKTRLGSIRREFPEELLDKTLEEIEKLARGKGELARKAKKALKLLKDGRFQKP